MACDQHGAPGAGVENFDGPILSQLTFQFLLLIVALEKPVQQWQNGFERIASAKVGDHLLLDLAVLAN